ncbi:hypothetical protein Tco_0260551 [Tanacetum coccineum]
MHWCSSSPPPPIGFLIFPLQMRKIPGISLAIYWNWRSRKVEVEYGRPLIRLCLLKFFNDPRIIREQRIAANKGYRGGRHVGSLEDDEEGLLDVLVKLETSFGELFCPCDAAAKQEEKGRPCAIFKLYKALQVTDTVCRSFLMGASFTQGTIPSISIGGSISPEGFLLSVLLLVVIIVTVVIVIVILIVVVVDDVSLILKLSFVIIGFLYKIMLIN